MDEPSKNGTFDFLPRSAYYENHHKRTALDDWESFLYALCEVNKVDLKWFDRKQFFRIRVDESRRICGDMKKNTSETIAHIKAKITCKHLQEVFVAFAHEAFKEDRSQRPNYDAFEELIVKKIEHFIENDELALFTWLSQSERDDAVEDLQNNPLVKATDIKFKPFKYPAVEYDYFAVQRDDMAQGQAPSQENYLRKKTEMTKMKNKKNNFIPKCLSGCFMNR